MPTSRLQPGQVWPLFAVLAAAALAGWVVGDLLPTGAAPGPPTVAPTPGARDEIVVSDQATPPAATPPLLPTVAQLYCYFRLEQVPAGTPVQGQWRLGKDNLGALDLSTLVLERQPFLAGHFTFTPPGGQPQFPPGIYQLTLRSGEQVLVETSFVVAQDAERILAQTPPPVGELRIVSLGTYGSLGPRGGPQQPATVFPPVGRVYAVFTYLNGDPAQGLVVRWYAAGVEIEAARQTVAMKAGAGTAYAWLEARGAGLPEGAYQVQVCLVGNNQPLVTADFTVKAGAVLPPVATGPAGVGGAGRTPS